MPAKRTRSVSLALAMMGVLGVAGAQTDDAAAPPAPPSADVTAQREVQLSPQQQVEEAQKYLKRMEQSAGIVRRMLEEARAARDVVKVLCLNDKLNQIDVAIRSATDRNESLVSAVERGDRDRARHDFTILQVLRDRVETLLSEARQCIGEETGFIGDSEVTVDIDPNIPDVDPADLGTDPQVITETPILTSPVQ